MSIFLAILAITFSVLLHEIGHLIAAVYFKVKVKTLSIGFGPQLFCKNYKGIDYKLSLIPVLGYVMFDENTNDKNYYEYKKWWQKIIISLAGPAVNFAIAFVLLMLVYVLKHHDEGFFITIYKSFVSVINIAISSVGIFFNSITHIHMSDFSGVVGTTDVAAKFINEGYIQGIVIVAVINMSLGLCNLFPLPGVLDGGVVFTVLIEKMFNRELSYKIIAVFTYFGYGLMLFMFIATTFMDIKKLF